MPVLVLPIPVYLYELLENRRLTATTSLGELGRVMIMTVHATLVLVIAVRGAKDGGTYGTREMFNVVFTVQCRNVRPPECLAAVITQEVKAAEIIRLAQGELSWGLFGHGEKFRGNDLVTILRKGQ